MFSVRLTDRVKKQIKQMDPFQAQLLLDWMQTRLEGIENPRASGKPLTGTKKQFWRYRAGNYRIICDIEDDICIILVISVGHRKDVYSKG